jgi:hypothetical protein
VYHGSAHRPSLLNIHIGALAFALQHPRLCLINCNDLLLHGKITVEPLLKTNPIAADTAAYRLTLEQRLYSPEIYQTVESW